MGLHWVCLIDLKNFNILETTLSVVKVSPPYTVKQGFPGFPLRNSVALNNDSIKSLWSIILFDWKNCTRSHTGSIHQRTIMPHLNIPNPFIEYTNHKSVWKLKLFNASFYLASISTSKNFLSPIISRDPSISDSKLKNIIVLVIYFFHL